MKPIMETERLILREMEPSDLSALCAILRDEQTMYAYERAFSQEEAEAWLDKQLNNYRRDGFGLWAVVLKDSGKMIGQCGLTRQMADGREVLEIGYLFNRLYWSRGYATEAARACRGYAFDRLGAAEVFSIIRDSNLASMNVAIRSGMLARGRFTKHYRGVDMPHLIFSVKNAQGRTADEDA